MASGQTPEEAFAEPKDLSHLYSETTKAREASRIKQFYKYFSIPGIGQLAGGLPNDKYFPYDTLESKVALPERWKPSEQATPTKDRFWGGMFNKAAPQPESHLLVPHTESTTEASHKIDLDTALQYGTAQGYPPLQAFMKEFATKHLHPTIPYNGGADVILTCGNTDGFSKTMQCFNNEWHVGDPIEEREGLLVEQFAYMGAIGTAKPRGLNIVPVAMDEDGMMAEGSGGLADVLDNWDFSKGKRPHLLYTVTIGQNPTGITLGMERRKALYEICQKYDIVIVEDDPYWYIQFPSARPNQAPVPKPKKSSGFPFLDSLMPSFLSIDVDGRVVRLDTFSKTVAPGCRLGWITAQPAVVERLLRITETSTQQPSGFVQSMIAELLVGPGKGGSGSGGSKNGTGWDMSGWVRWLEGLRGEYERRMTTMCDGLELAQSKLKVGHNREGDDWVVVKKSPIIEFNRPDGGMFVWIKLNFENHTLFEQVGGKRLSLAMWVFWTTQPYKVLVAPGAMFSPLPEIMEQEGWKYYRVCFAALPIDQLEDVTKRTVAGLKGFWQIDDVKVIDELLKDIDNGEPSSAVAGMTDMSALNGFC